MHTYSSITETITRDHKLREDALPLLDPTCRSQFFFHPRPTSRVFLLFHGFTAAPHQFLPMGEALYRAGYNVILPLMPGHGKAGNWGKTNPPPLPTDPQDYCKFAEQWLKLARFLGGRVIVGGLSGGGTLATWLAVEHATLVDRALIFAPYLSSSSKVIDLFVKSSDGYFEWSGIKCPSYTGFPVPALRVVLNLGKHCLNRARQVQTAPMFIVSSESDKAVGNRDHEILFESALKRQPKCWYQRFDRVLDIPHTMMTETEGNKYQNLLINMARAYSESDLTWAEVEEIAYRMTKGKTFDTVVAELNLKDKVSPDMPAMITMVDKWSIVVKRELSSRPRGRDR